MGLFVQKEGKKEGKNAENKSENKNDGGGGGGGEKKKEDGVVTVVMKLDIHCEGCALKIKKSVKNFEGIGILFCPFFARLGFKV